MTTIAASPSVPAAPALTIPKPVAVPIIRPPKDNIPEDADLLDLLLDWAPDDATRRKILVDNPAELFGF